MLAGGAAPASAAPCAINVTSGTVASVSTSSNINCINIGNATVTGGVTNAGGVIVAPTASSASNAITIDGATIGGSVVNVGTVNAPAQNGVLFTDGANALGGITNTGTISALNGIYLSSPIPTFSGGISNAGTISAAGTGIIINVDTFAGRINNSGTVTAQTGGIIVGASNFSGGVTNTGTITASGTGVAAFQVGTFAGGMTNSGTISSQTRTGFLATLVSQYSGGISNSGTISAAQTGISVLSVSTFGGGIINANGGTISAGAGITASSVTQFAGGISNGGLIRAGTTVGISIANISAFSGGISNSGTVSAANSAILVSGFSTFAGGIRNSGILSSLTAGRGVVLASGNRFEDGIANSGALTAAGTGIVVTGVAVFSGGLNNSGTLSSGGIGLYINSVTTFAGGISNSGAITAGLNGFGYGILTNSISSFSGGITNSGTISALGSGIYAASMRSFADGISNVGSISGGAGIYIQRISTFSGKISNAGTIATGIGNSGRISAGTYGIYADHFLTFAGGISNSGMISSGDYGIIVGNDARSHGAVTNSSFAGGITNSGTIATTCHGGTTCAGIYINNVAMFSGNISNAGTIAGSPGISIGGNVTFAAGSAIVNSGTITSSAAAIDVSQATSAVTIDQTGGVINGTIKLSANADVLNISGGTINGNIIGAGASDTINFAPGAGNGLRYAGSFSGINQVNINSGTVILNGSNIASQVDVNAGTLAGIGILDPLGVTVHSGATLQPGLPGVAGGRLSVVGSLAFQSAAVYLVTINGTSASSTGVTGTVVLGGAQVAIASGSSVISGIRYTILTDTGGGLGGGNAFDDQVSYGRLRGTLSYDADDVYVSFDWPSLGSLLPGAPANIRNTAAAIDHATGAGGSLPPSFQNLAGVPPTELAGALNKLTGEAATGARRSAFQMTTDFIDLMLGPFVAGRAGAPTEAPALGFAPAQPTRPFDDVSRAYAAALGKASPSDFAQRWSAWGAAYGGGGTAKGDPAATGSSSVTATTFGLAGGVDYQLTPSALAGLSFAGGGSSWGLANALGGGRSDAMQVGAYGLSRRGPAYIAAALSFSNHWFSTSRSALGDQLAANFTGRSYGGRFEGGYRYGILPSLGLTPYGALELQYFSSPAYRESDPTGGGFGLAYAATNATAVRTELGARFDAGARFYDKPLTLYGRIAWAHDFAGLPATGAMFEALPGSSFAVYGARLPPDSARTTVGAQLYLSAGWLLSGTVKGDFAPGSQSFGGNGTLRYIW